MIKFQCKNCGQKIRVPLTDAGEKGKCPKCKKIVIVPKIEDTRPLTVQEDKQAPI
jgi:hypothetical protein